jgi:hypothetical protein
MSRELAQPPADDAGGTGPAQANGETDATSDSGPADKPADRLWHSPAAGLSSAAGSTGNTGSSGATRASAGETDAPSASPGGGTYRLLTEDESGRYKAAAQDTDRSATGGSAALAGVGGDGGRKRGGDTAALSSAARTSREPRLAVGGTAAARRPGTDGATGGAGGPLRTAPDGAYEPLIGDAAALRAHWQRVQADFVDDPRAAVSDAADLVEHAAQVLVGALQQRQRQLRGLWDGPLAGDAGAPRDSGWPVGGRLRGVRPRRASRRGGRRFADEGAVPAAGASAPDGAGWPDAGGSPGQADGAAVDTTEHLRLVMQRYRALFNQICRP